MNSNISRRDFLRILKHIAVAMLSTTAISYYGLEVEPGWLDITEVEIPLSRLPKVFDGFRIVQISDIHMGGWMNRERLSEVLDLVTQQAPDLVVLTGDYVIGHLWRKVLDDAAEDFVSEMSGLTAKFPVVGVMGNHDHWTDPAKVRAMLSRSGILELKNDVHMIVRNGESLYIAGLDNITEGKERLGELTLKLPPNMNSILLAHEPDYADVSSPTARFGLQLSGHSHGGQIVIPFLGPPILPDLAIKYPSGLYRVGGMWLYTNRGVGMNRPFVRINCRPEITVFTLRSL